MKCAAMLIAFLGTTSPGYVVTVPADRLAGYSDQQITAAKACARRHGIRWRIVHG